MVILESCVSIQDPEAELAVLGAILLDPQALDQVRSLVRAEDFHRPDHALLFESMLALGERGVPIDVVTLAAELRSRDRLNAVGGPQRLGELTDALPTAAYVTTHALLVADRARARRVAEAARAAVVHLERGEPLDGPVAGQLAETLAREARRTALVDLGQCLESLSAEWEAPEAFTSTGLVQLDALLAGGLRAGDMVGVVGAAGGGKSAFVGQVALDAALAGAAVLYASVEMPPAEVLARWLALVAFRHADPSGRSWGIEYREVFYGRVWRGTTCQHPSTAEEVRGRLLRAMNVLEGLRHRVFLQQLEPGSTVDELRGLLSSARERARRTSRAVAEHPVVLIVDPLQRLFASARGGRKGRAAESVNALETERVGAVAQELKYLADTEGAAVLFTSDTTKAAALNATSSVASLRGSYQLNHLATLVLGLHTAPTAEELRRRLVVASFASKMTSAQARLWPAAKNYHRAKACRLCHPQPIRGKGR